MRENIDKTNEKFNTLSFSQFKTLFPSTENMKLPTAKMLKNMDVPIVVSLKTEEGTLTVYRNGFFTYETQNGHATVYAVDRCSRIDLYSARDKPSDAIDESSFGDCPWPKVLEFAASERIAGNINRDARRQEVMSLDSIDEDWNARLTVQSEMKKHVEEEDASMEESERLRTALAQITKRQREVIRLYYFDGLTQEEIASRLGIERSPVRKHLMAAQGKLKTILNELSKNTEL